MTTTTTTGGKKKGKGLLIAAAALGIVALAASTASASSSAPSSPKPKPTPTPTPTPTGKPEVLQLSEVIAIVAGAAASRDPKQMRAAAARLRAAGWPQQASDLEELARRTESLQPTPGSPSSSTPAPAPAPAKPPPASSTSPLPGIIPTSNPSPPAASKPPTSSTSSTSSAPRNLKRGDTGADVTAWQTSLNTYGFGLTPDGSFGSATESATKDFQTDMGLTRDGIVGPATRAALGQPPILGKRVLKVGSRGPAVKSWQIALLADGQKATVDGVFSTDIEAMTKIYQAARAIAADGIVGPATVAAIGPRKPAAASTPVATTIDPSKWRSPLKEGMSGKDVGEWQLVLQRDGYPGVKADGIFGPITTTASRGWQAARKLTADGIIGPASRAAIASKPATSKVAGDVDLATSWRPLRAVSPLPGLMQAEVPSEEVDAMRAFAARVAHNLHFAEAEREDRDLIAAFQQANGLNPTGAYGPGTAKALIAFGFVPPRIRYWPSKGTLQVKAEYRAELLAQAKRDRPRASEWLAAAKNVDG